MKWSFVLFLPALVSSVWGLAVMLLKRRPTRSQMLLSLMMLMVAFATVMLGVFFRGRAGSLFIYDFVFEVTAVLCAPMFYMGICSLVEPRGATLHQRQVFIIPLIFIIGLTAGAFWLGPRRYEGMCHMLRDQGSAATWSEGDGFVGFMAGDAAWNFMYVWDHWLFPVLVLVMCFVLIADGTSKVRDYQKRFNSLYAQNINVPHINNRELLLLAWAFIPIGVSVVFLIDFRPLYYKYWLIGCSVVLSVVQCFLGRFIWRLDYDARYLAQYIRNTNEIKQ